MTWARCAHSGRSWERNGAAGVGRVGMWRGGLRSTMSVAAPFVWRCLVTGRGLDLAEAGFFENAAHAVGVSERERAGRVRIVSGLRRQMSGRGPKRQDVERVLLQRSPADEGESPVRPEATTNVDERRSWVSEEHHPKLREGGVERGRFE